MKSYDLGIAIPNYNNSEYLVDCIESIQKQTYKYIKILVVDDCSTDNSIEILSELCKKYSNLRYIKNDVNKGVSYTRDRAIKELDTTYVTSIDSDDFYYNNNKIKNEMKLIKKYKEQYNEDIVTYSNIISVDKNKKFQKKNINENNHCNGNCFEKFITREVRIPTCSIYSKKLYEEINGFDHNIKMYEDWDFKIRLSKIAKFYYTNEDGFAYRHHSNGLSSAKKQEHIKWLRHVFEKNTKCLSKDKKYQLKKKLEKNVFPSLFTRVIRKLKRIIIK